MPAQAQPQVLLQVLPHVLPEVGPSQVLWQGPQVRPELGLLKTPALGRLQVPLPQPVEMPVSGRLERRVLQGPVRGLAGGPPTAPLARLPLAAALVQLPAPRVPAAGTHFQSGGRQERQPQLAAAAVALPPLPTVQRREARAAGARESYEARLPPVPAPPRGVPAPTWDATRKAR